MNFVSIRVITDDVQRLATFYATITGVEPVWGTPDFAELVTPQGTLAICQHPHDDLVRATPRTRPTTTR